MKGWRGGAGFVACTLLTMALLWKSGAPSYLSGRPEACAGCHLMGPRLDSWRAGGHAKVATCVDCHVPHGQPLEALLAKGSDGLRHAAIATLGTESRTLQARAADVLEANCLRCHSWMASLKGKRAAAPYFGRRSARPEDAYHADPNRSCLACHRDTSHRANPVRSAPRRAPTLAFGAIRPGSDPSRG
jgi:cytochrome c nitrite reductase small subunit